MEKQTAGIGKGTPGPGRKKGVPNKNTALIRDMIAQALDEAGGVEYLTSVAQSHPAPFLALVGKVLPVQLTGADGGPIEHSHATKEQRDAAVAAATRADT
jgi:hypothetical protein